MRAPSLRGRDRRWRTTVGAWLVPAVLATLAILHPGAPVSRVDLNDGSVWLTNTSALKLGRYNPQVDELNAGLVTSAQEFDVLQDAGDVLLDEPGKVSVVDPASVTLTAQAAVPFGADVSMAAGVVAVTAGGQVWARPTALVGTLAVDTDEPDVDLGSGGKAVVARDGTVLAVEPDGTLHRLRVGAEEVTVTEDGALGGAPSGGFEQVTAVGGTLVALSGSRLHLPSGSVDLSPYGGDPVLQQPGPRADTVLVATTTGLLEVPLDGGDVRERRSGGSGRPAAPVRVGTCAHGAWASTTGSYVRLCSGEDPVVLDLEGMTSSDTLVFRVNRDVVVLNETLRGRLWLPLEDPDLREPNWTDIEPEEETEEDEEESQNRESTQNIQAECGAQSSSPQAVDDSYGVRAGRTTILSVIDNDASSDCGILAVSEFDPLPEEFGTLAPVHGGRAFQLVTAPDAAGTVEFTYTIDDGRGTNAPSTATVTLTVRDAEENSAPEQLRVGSVVVEQGGSITYDVLADFRDPDGDLLVLTGATTDGGGTVRTRQDGELTFSSDGSDLGRRTVRVLVSDGTETVDGTVHVDVRPAGSVVPTIDPVHAVTYVDEPVTVQPLDSVRSSSREPVRLAGVEELPGVTLEADLEAGSFTFAAPTAGTYYVSFVVAVSPQQAEGVARIDVRERPEEAPPPVAVLDRALLPPGGEVTIDPLANDVDPGGGVLAVQSVEVPESSGLRVAVLNHRLLRLTSTRVLDAPVVARYTVSNGVAQAVGDIFVQPVPASATQQPPVVPDVEVSVRTGGVVTIPVLEDAYDPDGDPLRLRRTLPEPPGADEGLMFVAGDVLRYQAPATPGVVHATFEVEDTVPNRTAATVTIRVHASDPETKAPPRPQPLVARVFAEQTVRIPVPLTGIDADGDGVYLLGQDRAPTKGRIVDQGADWLEYEALPGELGTDTFTYAVEDWVGQRAVATVRVGIVARPSTAAEVVSRNDDVTVRPGRTVEVRVLANDVDTSGGELTLEPGLEVPEGVVARAEGRRVVVEAPDSPGVVQIVYTASNERGGLDRAVLTVRVADDARIDPPIARDVVVPATETINRTSVDVDVLAVAENPSGPLADLEVSVHPSAAEVATVSPTGRVVVTLGPTAQTLPYLLTNTSPEAEGASSYAFITVPALGDFPPIPRPRAPELRVVAGEPLRIPLAEQIQVAPGRTVRITDPSTVTATKSDGSPLVEDERTLLYTAQRSYAGPASISFTVTDGATGDYDRRTKVMTLPITVLAAEDYPPTFSPSVLDVAPGEATEVDLRAFTSAPVGTETGETRYTYAVTTPAATGFEVTLDGSRLRVAASPTVPKGTIGGIGLRIGYGVDRAVDAQVDFRVVASSRPLARVLDHVVPDGVEGGASTVRVLDGAFNPFPSSPLTLVSAVVETPDAGTAGVSGDQVTVRPAAGFIGSMVTRFRVRDVTGDPDREVEGRITVVVRGRPDAPAAPRVVEVRDRTVVLAWDAPANNGEPITGYRVTAQPGGTVVDCPSTTCTVPELTNNVEYTFTVTAQNAVDWSDPSPRSQPARPDAKPFAPGAPRVDWGDGSLTAAWTAPENPGSPITSYDLEISPAPPGGSATVSTASTSHTFTGLANGTAYSVRVRAINLAPDPGDWSERSASVVPAGVPGAPVLTGQRFNQSIFGGGRLEVSWPDPEANGDPIARYEIRVDGGEARPPSSRNLHVVDPAGPGTYTFQVRAFNKAGAGPWSPLLTVDYATVPSQVTGLSAEAVAAGTVELTFDEPDWAGSRDQRRFEVQVDGGAFTPLDGRRVGNLAYGQHSFSVRACNAVGCGSQSATATASVTTRPGAVQPVGISFDDPDAPTTFTGTWQPPTSPGAAEVWYEYRYATARARRGDVEDVRWGDWSDWTRVDGTSTGALEIPADVRLSGGRVAVTVRAVNAPQGSGPETSPPMEAVVPAPAPEPPPDEPPAEP